MDGEEGGGPRLSKRINDGEVDYKNKSGTAWSHSYLNQKPWHPLSYPNQRRKWIAEQTHAQRQRRAEEVAREYAQEQEFFRQTSLVSQKEREKIEMMKSVSFMYIRPPGYNAESAKAVEVADEMKRSDFQPEINAQGAASSSIPPESVAPSRDDPGKEKKKSRPKDVFGRPLPTEEEFEVLKNAPRMETGVPARVKPFAIEVRNVKCVRCGNFGHQSGDRECPLKDVIMPNEESRLKRDDPLTAIMAQMDPSEPLKWELKQKPGISPPRGGFNPDDPNQQIVAEDIFDEYGGFLSGGSIPELLTNFSPGKKKSKKCKHKKEYLPNREFGTSEERELKKSKWKERKKRDKKKTLNHSESSSSDDDDEYLRHPRKGRSKFSSDYDSDTHKHSKKKKLNHSESSSSDNEYHRHSRTGRSKYTNDDYDIVRHHRTGKSRQRHSFSSYDSGSHGGHTSKKIERGHSYTSKHLSPSRHKNEKSKHSRSAAYSSEDSDLDDRLHIKRHEEREKMKHKQSLAHSEDSDLDVRHRSKRHSLVRR